MIYASVFLASSVVLLAAAFAFSSGSRTTVAADQPSTGQGAQERLAMLERQLLTEQSEQARRMLFGFVGALFVMAVISVLLGRVMAGHVLGPVRVITEVTQRISADSLNQRIAVHGPDDEVKHLADTIDGLLERLETSFAAQRRFVANASHELRTPLATMRATLDVAVAKPGPAASTVALADRLRTQLDRVDHLIDGLLVLARAQHGRPAESASIDLADLVATSLRERSAEAAAKRLAVTVDVPARTFVQGSPALLARLVANVVDNAVTHNEDDGWIRITGALVPLETVLIVETGGRLFDQDEVARLTRPFERLGEERVGSAGLGLSIVSAVAAAHYGRLRLAARPAGGLRVEIGLPSGFAGAEERRAVAEGRA